MSAVLDPIQTASGPALAQAIESAWGEELKAARGGMRGGKRPYVFASQYHPCARSIALSMTKGDELPPFDAEVLARMERGLETERDLLIYLAKVGHRCDPSFLIVSQQERFELRDHKGRVAIVGKMDARLKFNSGSYPLEVKKWSPNLVNRLDTFEDLFKSFWTKKGAYQLLSYLFGTGEPLGFLLLDRAGIPKLIPVELDKYWDRVEEFLQLAETAIDHVEAGTEPDFLPDAEICKRCDFYGSHCNPPLLPKDQLQILADPELEAMLARREELKNWADEFEDLDKEAKKRLKGVKTGLCGPFLVEGSERSRGAYAVKESKYWTMKIVKV